MSTPPAPTTSTGRPPGYSARRYSATDAAAWDTFIEASRNGTFLFRRAYMDYHAERFPDHSVLVEHDGVLVAVLPATAADFVAVSSHAGLSYGGLVLARSAGFLDARDCFRAVVIYFAAHGFQRLHYKTLPWIYGTHPSDDDRHALFAFDARMTRCDVLLVVPRARRLAFQARRARGVRQAQRHGVTVECSEALEAFWPVLEDNLAARHGVQPVHSLAEMLLLRRHFPQSIQLFLAWHCAEVVAGVVVYETETVAHVQYIASTPEGRELHALDAVFSHLLNEVYAHKDYFDFGNTSEPGRLDVNEGLLAQKEGFGARCVTQAFYDIDLRGA